MNVLLYLYFCFTHSHTHTHVYWTYIHIFWIFLGKNRSEKGEELSVVRVFVMLLPCYFLSEENFVLSMDCLNWLRIRAESKLKWKIKVKMAFFNTNTRWYLLRENTMVFLFYCGYFVLKHHILLMNNLIFWSFDQRNLKVFDSNILCVYTKTLQKLHLLTLILTILTKILVGKKMILRKYNYNFHFLVIILCTDRGWKASKSYFYKTFYILIYAS